MNLTDCLRELQLRGLTLRREGNGLRVDGPKGRLTPELRAAVLANKPAILQRLADTDAPADETLPACVPAPGQWCEPFPLSDLQLGFYLAQDPFMEFHVRPHGYTEKDGGDIDVPRYTAAWNKVLRRHWMDLVTVQPDGSLRAHPEPAPLACEVIDLCECPPGEVQDALAELRANMMRSELPQDRWPWLDLRISRWREGSGEGGKVRCRVHLNLNSFFLDFYASARLMAEVDRCYREPALELPARTLSYRDAVLALEQLADTDAGRAARSYWEQRVPHLPPPPAVPLKAGLDRRCRSHLTRREQRIDAVRWQAFKQHAQRASVTPSNALFTAYAEVLAAWSNSRHFVLSNMMTRRLEIHPEIWDVLGNFASLYPLEVDLREGAGFAARARRLQEQVVRDSQHLAWGGMRVMQALNREAGGFGRAPVPFVLGSALFAGAIDPFDFVCLETSQVLIDSQFFELEDGCLNCVWDLFEAFFPEGLIDAMWAAYGSVIERLADDPALWDEAAFELVPAAHLEERRLVTPPSTELSTIRLEDVLRRAACEHPGGVALQTPAGACSYAELDRLSDALAARLQAQGVQAGQNVAIVADRGPGFLTAVFAALKAGAAYVPIDPALPVERIDFLLGNSEAACLLADPRYARALEWPQGLPVVHTTGQPAGEPALHSGTCTDLAYLIYTSGSTGVPKGVMIEHRGAVNTVLDVNHRFNVGPHDRLFGVSSCGFDLSVYDVFGAAAAGATLVYPEPAEALNPAHWLDVLSEQRVTVWNSAPPLAVLLAEAAELRGLQLPELRLVLLSGDWIPVDLPGRLRRIAPHARIVSLGGATEASIWSILYEIGEVDPAWPSIPYGYPMQNQPWHILDELGRLVPQWTPGELHIGGDGLARGYWRDEARTAERFILHPVTGERLYRTGDIGRYLPGGVIEFLGRRDSQVKIQGHRIELGEIESVLSACAGVGAAVVVVEKPQGGAAQLAAHVVPAAGCDFDAALLREQLARKLPDYMVPRLIGALPRLPLTPNGKVDRKALPCLAGAAPKAASAEASRPPCDALEAGLLDIWRTVLGNECIGVADDFFDLGGQSFEAVRVVARIRETLGRSVSMADVWQQRTVAALAARLRSVAEPARPRCLVEIHAGGAGEPLFLVHPAGGQVMCYQSLAERLGRPVHAFEAAGADGTEPMPDTVEDFAQRYLSELEAACPEGPVWLGGWSSGAPVAYEMAVRLQQRGREVRGVLVIDSPAPLLHGSVDEQQALSWFLEDLNLDPAVLAAAQACARLPRGADPIERVAALLRANRVKLGADARQLAAVFAVFRAMVRATRAYRPRPAELALLVIRARDGMVSEFARHPHAGRPDWGWAELATRVEGHAFGGTHFTLLNPPALDEWCPRLQGWLQSAAQEAAQV